MRFGPTVLVDSVEMDPSQRQRKKLWTVIGLGLAWLVSQFLPVALPMGKPLWFLPDAVAFVFGICGLLVLVAMLGLVLTHWRSDRDLALTTIKFVIYPCLLSRVFADETTCVNNRVRATTELRVGAEAWLRRSTPATGSLELPPNLKPLTFGRAALSSSHAPGCVYFPHQLMFDNSEGMVYCKDGKPPDPAAFFKITSFKRIDEQWFWVKTT